ncbi:MAG: DNA-binding IclR family transcriptional regulator [Psychromonas sp.]|jgi:DNA-binding IclR family transcriptional regulator|uniref:IclR family transcriptional regulator n=1 Tax=Psychromonas sp. TaxID=1884585 RepID=UPI0039E4F52E
MTTNLALFKAIEVINAIAAGNRNLKDVCASVAFPKSTVHRILQGLIDARYIRDMPGIGLVLGTRIIQLGNIAQNDMPIKEIAHPFLRLLSEETNETVHLGIKDEDEVFYLDKVPGNRSIQLRSKIGDRLPLASTGVGKALMLDMPIREIHRLIKSQIKKNPDEIIQRMKSYVAKGYCFDLEDNDDLVYCVAVPIRSHNEKIIASISITSVKEYMPIDRMNKLVSVLKRYAEDIEDLI